MNCRTGDILIWRSTGFYDTLSDVTIGIKGLHSGLILVGNQFEELSVCGRSPSQTYVTFLIDKVFPIEEIVGHVWTRPNGAALYHIRRIDGPDIPDDEAIKIIRESLNLKKLSVYHSVYIAVAAFLKWGELAPATGYENKKWQVCSLFIGHLLDRMGLLSHDSVTNNLLPLDFYNVRFYQVDNYERIVIFDKETYKMDWWFSGFLIRSGHLKPLPVNCEIVDTMLANYNYPRADKTKFQSTQQMFTEI
jgi:hypothetical protein